MKKFLIILCLCVCGTRCFAQITLDTIVNKGGILTKLEKSGYKYLNYYNDSIFLYNLDWSDFKSFPVVWDATLNPNLRNYFYVTEALFDTDSSTVEYMLYYSDFPVFQSVRVFNEFGDTLLFRDSTDIYVTPLGFPYAQYATNVLWHPIENTSAGTKLHLFERIPPYHTEIYNLPGRLECNICASDIGPTNIQEIKSSGQGMQLTIEPNPFSNKVTADYTLDKKDRSGTLFIFNSLGNEVKHIELHNAKGNLKINGDDLKSGIYYFQLISKNGNATSLKMIKIE
jgi:hypothetical protein